MMILALMRRVLPLILMGGVMFSCSSLPVRQVENPFPVRDGLTAEVMEYTLYEVNTETETLKTPLAG